MDDYGSLSHSRWECKYHVVFIPKCRRKVLYGQLRGHLGEVFRTLAEQKESRIEEGHLMADHVHMMLSHPAEIRGFAGCWVHQGQKCHPFGARVRRTQTRLCRTTLLGARVFCIDGRTRRSDDTRLHPPPGGGGSTPGTTEPAALAAYRRLRPSGRVSATVYSFHPIIVSIQRKRDPSPYRLNGKSPPTEGAEGARYFNAQELQDFGQ